MKRLFSWSMLFLMVPILGTATFVVSAMTDSWPLYDHWFPEDISEHGYVIDSLFDFILVLTGVIFIGTGLTLFWFLWRYDAERNTEATCFTHGNHTLEVVWSILPGATLLFIAIYQMNAWANNKIARPLLSAGPDQIQGTGDDVLVQPIVEVKGRQFEWRIRYAGRDGRIGTPDDVFTVNDLHLPVGEQAVIAIKSEDVLHSFFLPNARIKQDLVPGMKQFVWFRPIKTGTYDLVCAELCGWGHYKMKGRLTVETRETFDRWLDTTWAQQQQGEFTPSQENEEG